MANRIVLDGELSLNIPLDGEVGTVIEVGHNTGIDTIVFNADYTLTFNMTNGETFTTGSIRGEQGETGAKGDKGDAGDDYVLTQADKQEIAGLVDTSVDDVQINGTSIVQDGVANIPYITSAKNYGLTKLARDASASGLWADDRDGILYVATASVVNIKAGTNRFAPITPIRSDASTFYGLAKAAGHDEKDSTLPVGQYTEEAKTAIRTMLGIDKESLIAEIRDALNL